jgi:anthranilate 1,2-dioxygenase small subunit
MDIDSIDPVDKAMRRELRFEVEEFHAEYAAVLDAGDVQAWTGFFTEDAVYKVLARDNAEANLPLCLVLCQGMGMIKDRAYAIMHTEMFAARYVQHQISMTRITGIDGDIVSAEANYLVFETLIDEPTRLLQAGKYKDRFVRTAKGLRLKERTCIFDTVIVPNCLVYPV